MEPVNYYKLGKRLYLRYPDIARQLLNDEPMQRDVTGQISTIYQKFTKIRTDYPGGAAVARLEFITIIVKHTDPEVFTTCKKLKAGVRSELAELFECDGSAISHMIANAKSYMRIYADFRDRIEQLYSEIFET